MADSASVTSPKSLKGLIAVVGICLVITIISIVSLTGWSDLRSQRQILNQTFLIPLEPSDNVLITNSNWQNLSVDSQLLPRYGINSSVFTWDGQVLATTVNGESAYLSIGANNSLVFARDTAAAANQLTIVYSNAAQTAYIACKRGNQELFLSGSEFLTTRPFGRPFRVFSK